MTRLPRSRRGKTPIDIVVVTQESGPRVRLTLGDDYDTKRNSDLDFEETEALIVLLRYHLAKAKGEI